VTETEERPSHPNMKPAMNLRTLLMAGLGGLLFWIIVAGVVVLVSHIF
jgi:hypothetical protein